HASHRRADLGRDARAPGDRILDGSAELLPERLAVDVAEVEILDALEGVDTLCDLAPPDARQLGGALDQGLQRLAEILELAPTDAGKFAHLRRGILNHGTETVEVAGHASEESGQLGERALEELGTETTEGRLSIRHRALERLT